MNIRQEYNDWKLYLLAKYNTDRTQLYARWVMLTIVLCLLVFFGFMTGLQW